MKRPTFLTIWLTLMSIGAVYTIYIYTIGLETSTASLLPSWALFYFRIAGFINLFSVGMLWKWKKIGFYIFSVLAFFTAAVNGAVLGTLGIFASALAIIGVGILYLAMKPVWKTFN